jgi:hypothetical protein
LEKARLGSAQTRQGPSPWIALYRTVDHAIQESGAMGVALLHAVHAGEPEHLRQIALQDDARRPPFLFWRVYIQALNTVAGILAQVGVFLVGKGDLEFSDSRAIKGGRIGGNGREPLCCRSVLPVQLLQLAFELREFVPETG